MLSCIRCFVAAVRSKSTMAMPTEELVGSFSAMRPYPNVAVVAGSEGRKTLADFKGRPLVVHLYTG